MSARLIRYTLDGIKLTHDISFGVTDGDGFDVYVNRTKLDKDLDYKVVGTDEQLRGGDGVITLTIPHAASDVLLILSDTLARRVTNFAKAARFEEAEIDNEFDNLLRLLEDASLYLTSTPYFNPVDIGLVDGQLPPVIAGGVLRVNEHKNGFELVELDKVPEFQEALRKCTEQADMAAREATKAAESESKAKESESKSKASEESAAEDARKAQEAAARAEGMKTYPTTVGLNGFLHPSIVTTDGFRLFGVGAGRWATTGNGGAENYTPSLNQSGQIVITTSDGVEFKYAPENGIGDPAAVGLIPNDLTVDNESKWTALIAPNDTEIYKWDLKNNNYRMSVWKVRKQKITSGPAGKIQVFYGGSNPVMGQVNTGAKIRDVNLFCEESNLNLARCGFTNADDFEWIGGSISGFRDTVDPVDAWGAYFENCSGRMIRVGFKDNSQSDIAMVGNCKNLEVEGCYNIESGDSVHINLEPLTSTDLNQNITLSNMDLKKLSLLENGTGGTANQQITVNSCYIDNFVNDGATVSFISTRFNDFNRESTPYFGSYSFVNSLGLGENLLKDPYVMNVGFGSAGAATNNNDWYYKAATGGIDSGNVMKPLNQDGFRFIRFNSAASTGTFDIEALDGIDLGAGGVLAIVITGRSISGSSGAYFKYKSSATGAPGSAASSWAPSPRT